jgi:hypothetical protein
VVKETARRPSMAFVLFVRTNRETRPQNES